jgi:hypothetical protein
MVDFGISSVQSLGAATTVCQSVSQSVHHTCSAFEKYQVRLSAG